MSTRWDEISKNHDGASAGALLFMTERKELEDLKKLKRMPLRAVLMLERSIQERAQWLIHDACMVYTA